MTDPTPARVGTLHALIEQWRQAACDRDSFDGIANRYAVCANELEAALAALSQEETQGLNEQEIEWVIDGLERKQMTDKFIAKVRAALAHPPPKGKLVQALGSRMALMCIRDWVDEGIAVARGNQFSAQFPGLASEITAQVWLHVREALEGEQPAVCHCGESRAAHTYYRAGGIFTACKICGCEAYEPSPPPVAAPGETQERTTTG